MGPYLLKQQLADKFTDADPEVRDWAFNRAHDIYGEFSSVYGRPNAQRIGMWRAKVKRDFINSELGQRHRKKFGLLGIFSWWSMISLVVQIALEVWKMMQDDELNNVNRH